MVGKVQWYAVFLILVSFSWLCIHQGIGDANQQPNTTFLNSSHVVVKSLMVEPPRTHKNVNSSGPSPCGPGHCPQLNN
ncbi:hypothetical protein CR513_14907, partial [Mucuna pruriens]